MTPGLTPQTVRIAFIGAGGIARSRHLPELSKLPQAQVVAVANRSLESGQAVAKAFNIPEVSLDWRALIARPDIDAVFIGTWPSLHEEMSVAALAQGKHVFCQARMAMDLDQAKRMLAASQARPDLVNMVCPPPSRMPFEPYIKSILSSGRLGQIISVRLTSVSGTNLDRQSVHWRERSEISGKQVMQMGIFAETLHALLGPYASLEAQTDIPITTKKEAQGNEVTIRVPQVVTISGRLASGALAVEQHLGLATDTSTRGDELVIWGLQGTLRYRFGNVVELAEPGSELVPVTVPAEFHRPWQVERDFIAAVQSARQGQAWSVSPDFAEALLYMRKVEAVHLSAQSGRAVSPGAL
jgi:predicted dehydrogenase